MKSPERVLSSVRVTSPEPVQNGDETPAHTMQKARSEKSINSEAGSEEAGTKKKVVKVVRKMVRKVIPQEDTGRKNEPGQGPEKSQPQSPIPQAPAMPKTEPKKEKDDISVGLASLMTRGRMKEHKNRFKLPEKKVEPAKETMASPTPPIEKTSEKSSTPVPPASEEEKISDTRDDLASKAASPDLSIKTPQKPSGGLPSEVCTYNYLWA